MKPEKHVTPGPSKTEGDDRILISGQPTNRHPSIKVDPRPEVERYSAPPDWGEILECVQTCSERGDCTWRPYECRLLGGDPR